MTKAVEREKAEGLNLRSGLFVPKKLGIYIQVPFCQTKCTYCNFHTGVASPSAYAPYARAVKREIRNWRAFHPHRENGVRRPARLGRCHCRLLSRNTGRSRTPRLCLQLPSRIPAAFWTAVRSGVRTPAESAGLQKPEEPLFRSLKKSPPTPFTSEAARPTLLDPADLARILDAVRSQFGAGRTGSGGTCTAEATLEADPKPSPAKKPPPGLPPGINRMSLGSQSFHETKLTAAGRMHRRQDILDAIARLRSKGFANISLDLIAGLPDPNPRKLARLPRGNPAPPPRAHLRLSFRG